MQVFYGARVRIRPYTRIHGELPRNWYPCLGQLLTGLTVYSMSQYLPTLPTQVPYTAIYLVQRNSARVRVAGARFSYSDLPLLVASSTNHSQFPLCLARNSVQYQPATCVLSTALTASRQCMEAKGVTLLRNSGTTEVPITR